MSIMLDEAQDDRRQADDRQASQPIVAECWTCAHMRPWNTSEVIFHGMHAMPLSLGSVAEHNAAGHDVRPIGGQKWEGQV